jgi:hypothetical protein
MRNPLTPLGVVAIVVIVIAGALIWLALPILALGASDELRPCGGVSGVAFVLALLVAALVGAGAVVLAVLRHLGRAARW